MLEKEGSNLFPQMLCGTETPGILKLRVKGNVQLRPMLCRGPIEIDKEFTLLLGACEVGGKLVRRLMGALGLKAIFPKPNLSKPNQAHKVYLYLRAG